MTRSFAEDTGRPLLLTPAQAALEMSIARSTLYLLLARQEIKYVKIGAATRVPTAEVERWITTRLAGN